MVKDDVGKSKPSTFKLPPQGFVYGKPENKMEHRGSILTGGYDSLPALNLNKTKTITDFKKLNKVQAFARG